uniref:Uncharacterized protein n=1 Tax=Oryza meridionalis TaxID=40149 RepID=A0A0E0D932_9ORYZ
MVGDEAGDDGQRSGWWWPTWRAVARPVVVADAADNNWWSCAHRRAAAKNKREEVADAEDERAEEKAGRRVGPRKEMCRIETTKGTKEEEIRYDTDTNDGRGRYIGRDGTREYYSSN